MIMKSRNVTVKNRTERFAESGSREAGKGRFGRMYGKIVKKTAAAMALIALMALALAGCGGTKLAEGFDEETVEKSAREAVSSLVKGEYDAIVSKMSPDMQAAVPAADLAANMELMNAQTGAFQEYKSVAVVGQEGADGTDAAVAVIVAEFENCDVTYTISYNTDMEIIGLWMK